MKAFNKQYFVKGAVKLLFELLIVFFGVLLAFVASDWANKRTQQQRFERALHVLHQEIADFITYSPIPIQAMQDSLQRYREKRDAGAFPAPGYYREPRASGAPAAAWEALLASGAYEILDPFLFYQMTIYYNRVLSANAKYARYMQHCEAEILPLLHDSVTVFYEQGKMKSKYIWSMEMLAEIIQELTQLGEDAKVLRNKLAVQFPSLE